MREKENKCIAFATHAIGLDKKNRTSATEGIFTDRIEITMMQA